MMQQTLGGNDYQLAMMDFPHGVLGLVRLLSDGTYYVFLNNRLTAEWQQKVLDHELRHIDRDHLYNDILTVEKMEAEANGEEISEEVHPEIPDVFEECPRYGLIPEFQSMDSLRKYVHFIAHQRVQNEKCGRIANGK